MAAGSLPLADAPALWPFARRTRLVRLGLGVAVLGLFAAMAYSAFHLHTRATSYFAQGGRGILVIDLSASVDPRANPRPGYHGDAVHPARESLRSVPPARRPERRRGNSSPEPLRRKGPRGPGDCGAPTAE